MRLNTILKLRTVLLVSVLATGACASDLQAGFPWQGPWPWSKYEGSRRVDVIGPLGNRLPESYRRKYNRPTYIGGKIASKVEPSSQEAIAFQRAEELGLYDNNGVKGALNGKHCPPQRVEQHYFYPKPWEVLAVGPRKTPMRNDRSNSEFSSDAGAELLPVPQFEEPNEHGDYSPKGGYFGDPELNASEDSFELPQPVMVDPLESDLELPTPGSNSE
ncbi:hypothetical protein [Rhodopirellula sallentina]|uniref:Signal peptide protein n=1 Tax=Rhodopirellula sallentina SM41 TaxID=1263870 RepID=M5U523_9BACT|nr:hypothetical protein [Rhodopirellula sallentina]EMI56545.1 signal peptide protein [Rhodopirellula sallentina SM41]